MAGISIRFSNAKITPIQLDGGFEIARVSADEVGVLHPGERVDVLLEWNQEEVKSFGSTFTVSLDPE